MMVLCIYIYINIIGRFAVDNDIFMGLFIGCVIGDGINRWWINNVAGDVIHDSDWGDVLGHVILMAI